MSRLSIYETRWIDLIFEHKNQEYGAYQLRRDSVRTSVTALFMGLLFVASIGGITTIVSHFNRSAPPAVPLPEWSIPVQVSDIVIPIVEQPVLPQVQRQTTAATIDKDQLTNPVIVHPQDANSNIATNLENTNTTAVISTGTGTTVQNPISSGTGTEPIAVDNGDTVVNAGALDQLPAFPGGISKFYAYVGNNFEKPEIDEINTFRVYISFIIEKDGSMTDIQVTRDPGFGLGKEAIRVLKSLRTKWSPGMIDSKPVRTAYHLPIVVEMQ